MLLQVIGDKWDSYLDLIMAYSEGCVAFHTSLAGQLYAVFSYALAFITFILRLCFA
jgi:hypothetical protein